MTLRSMISDYRLKQIFCSEGGEAFLQDLIKTSEGALCMHLHKFMRHITEGKDIFYCIMADRGSIWGSLLLPYTAKQIFVLTRCIAENLYKQKCIHK